MTKNICVYCSSSNHVDKKFFIAAQELGAKIVQKGYGLVYGGTNTGLMGEIAKAVCSLNGKVIGIIPQKIKDHGLAFDCVSELIITENMRQRKELMERHSDIFIAMPGGFGTLEELFEILTSGQLGFHSKPVAIINVNGFYDNLKKQLDFMVNEKMLLEPHAKIAQFVNTPEDALEALNNYTAPKVEKWIDDIRKDNGHL